MGQPAEHDPLFADEDDAPPLGFEAWVELSVQRLQRAPEERAAVLDRAGVKAADWEAADARWTQALLGDLGRGSMERAERYGARCAAELRRRAAEAESAALPSASPSPLPPPLHPGSVTADALPVPRGNPLPFAERPQAPAGAAPPAIAAPSQAGRPPPAGFGETASLPQGILPRGAALPFAGAKPAARPPEPPPRDLPTLSLEQYAAMCAESSLGGASLEQALGRYGLTDVGVWRAVDQAWQARLSADPALMQRWLDLTGRYRELLKRRPG